MQTAMAEKAVERKRLVLVDGSGYIFRAYHALPPLTRRDGTPVGAVMGFCNMLLKLIDTMETEHLAVIFDKGRISFRHEIYPDYKANRAETPEDLIPQFPIIREATAAFNVPAIEMENYEADDLIASYAKAAAAEGYEVIIVSSDKDLMQLIGDSIRLHDPMKNKPIGPEQVMEKFGVEPNRVTDVQALIGDSVDNVPGVPGIGPKTAAELMQQFGTLEDVLARASEIKQNKRRESLIEYADQARLSYELVQLKDDVPLPVSLDDLVTKPIDVQAVLNFLQEQEFNTLLKKMEMRLGRKAPERRAASVADGSVADGSVAYETSYTLVQDIDALQTWVKRAYDMGYIAVDTETTSLNAMQAQLVGISLSVQAGEACYIPLNHVRAVSVQAGQSSLFGDDDQPEEVKHERITSQLSAEKVLDVLKPMFADDAVLKIGQNIKYDLLVLKKYGVEMNAVDDSMLLSYVTASGLNPHNMDDLSELHLGVRPIAFKDVCGTGKSQIGFAEVELDKACDYAAEDADLTLRLQQKLKQQLINDKLVSVYETIERPLIQTIVTMEANGIRVNPKHLEALSDEFAQQMEALEKEIYRLSGHPFNIGSPKQLGEVLFDEMGIEGGKKSGKTGAYSTGAEVLEELAAGGHELPRKVLQWRQLSKLKSTYTDALVKQINPDTGRIHTSFSMAATTTGRLSSSDPNLQNIPIRTTEGKRIREAFIAEQGCKLISADYSQIELRLLADIANIEPLKDAFMHGKDIHATTASQMFGVPVEEVESELRRKAKTINFGIIYGISAHGLATRLGIGRGEAAEYIDAYFEQYPGIRKYMESTKQFAREHGFVKTLYGRKIHVKDIHAKNPNLRAFSERAAINAPLQGTAADIIKRAMVSLDQRLAASFPEAKLLLQVHDELIVECPESQAEKVARMVQKTMQSAAHLSIPMLVETGIGNNWGEIH